MKREYESPKAEIIAFDSEDVVIRTTGGTPQSTGSVGNVLGSFF